MPVRQMPPGDCLGCGGTGIPASSLPALPWTVEIRSPSGRVLTALTVHDGDVQYESGSGGSAARGVASRVDLSCGRIDVWVGPPVDGPAPGSGTPGDCDP